MHFRDAAVGIRNNNEPLVDFVIYFSIIKRYVLPIYMECLAGHWMRQPHVSSLRIVWTRSPGTQNNVCLGSISNIHPRHQFAIADFLGRDIVLCVFKIWPNLLLFSSRYMSHHVLLDNISLYCQIFSSMIISTLLDNCTFLDNHSPNVILSAIY